MRDDGGRHLGKGQHRRGEKHQIGVPHPGGGVPADAVHHPQLQGFFQVGQPPADTDDLAHRPGGLESQGQRTADQPDADNRQSGDEKSG